MRRVMVLKLTPQAPSAVPWRRVRNDDAEALARLMLAAYRGTIDDEGGMIDDARGEVARLLDGAYGELLPSCSIVTEEGDSLTSACLVTVYEGAPFVAFSMTDPAHKRHGLARACLQLAINALVQRGDASLRLMVTRGNEPAERLYELLGFEDE
ncbi:MAG: GNAT family N-acetyltransferase [Planctomycetota bacterium]|jgi:ribosomal protein S18 acetylase RimI-like enzyme